MKRILSIVIVGILVLSGLGAVTLASGNTQQKIVSIAFSQPAIDEQNQYATISMDGTNSVLMRQNKPMLPSYIETFTFPFGTKIKSVTVTPTNIQTQTISKDVAPTPPMVAVSQDVKTNVVEPLDYGTEPYPSSWFEYDVGCGLYNGVLSIIASIQIYPIKYHPEEKIIEWTNDANIVVEYEPSTQQTSYSDNYQFVVIGPSDFSGQIAPLITHKISRNITSKFVSLTDIYSGTYFPATGRDNQEKIKYFIKNAIESWGTVSVLLVGGSSLLPARDTHVYIADDPDYGDEIFTSDLYYADIYNGTGGFCSWDSNNNNLFGEYNWNGQTDAVDLHPDVYLSRMPATSGSQVTACVNKIITYETTSGYQQSWFPNLVVVGGDSFDDTNAIDEGEYANQKVVDLMTGFIPNKLWASNGMLTSLVPTGLANIKTAINDGCGFVDFNGHGNTNIWASHSHSNFNTWIPTPWPPGGIRSTDVQTLSNGDKLPIVTVEACDTAKFASDTNCFNWAFLYNSNGGAIGTFGATGIGYSYVGTGVTQGLIGKMGLDTYKAYKINGATSFGEMWSQALGRYIKPGMTDADYKSVEEWQAFGDPTLAIAEKSDPPAKPAMPSGPASGKVGTEYTYTTSTTDSNGDKVYYMFDWGDGTTSGWVGPFNSGATASAKKTWTIKGSYQVKAVAKDVHGVLSVWSDPLPISMPRNKISNQMIYQILERLLERFQHAFPILRELLTQ